MVPGRRTFGGQDMEFCDDSQSIWKGNFHSILPGVLYCEGEDL